MVDKKEVPKKPEEIAKPSMVDKAIAAAADLRLATKEMKAENDRKEQLATKAALGGNSEGGQPQPTAEDPVDAGVKKLMGVV